MAQDDTATRGVQADPDAMVAEVETGARQAAGLAGKFILLLAFLWSLFQLYIASGVPFFLTHCTGCHSSTIATEDRQGAPANVNFDNVDEIVAQADRVWARSADQNETMPPINSVSAAERAMLGEWLACGAPLKAE